MNKKWKIIKKYVLVCSQYSNSLYLFFSIWVFFHEHSQITGLQRKGEGISLTPQYHFHPLHRHLDISRAISAESSPLHIGSSRTQTGNHWFLSASRKLFFQFCIGSSCIKYSKHVNTGNGHKLWINQKCTGLNYARYSRP